MNFVCDISAVSLNKREGGCPLYIEFLPESFTRDKITYHLSKIPQVYFEKIGPEMICQKPYDWSGTRLTHISIVHAHQRLFSGAKP